MKSIATIILGVFILMSCNTKAKKSNIPNISPEPIIETSAKDTSINFESDAIGKLPNDWSQAFTGRGDGTEWKVLDDNGNKVIAQLSKENPNYHFNVVVYNHIITKNMELEVRLKGVTGDMDQGGGFVWRYTDADNYYVVRANPLEDNVVLYKVINGKRTDLPLIGKGRTYGIDVPKLGSGWNTLGLKVENNLFTVYLNSKEIFKVRDNSIITPGKVGLWTKADAVTYFDDYNIKTY